jgi:hypothetical protein
MDFLPSPGEKFSLPRSKQVWDCPGFRFFGLTIFQASKSVSEGAFKNEMTKLLEVSLGFLRRLDWPVGRGACFTVRCEIIEVDWSVGERVLPCDARSAQTAE